VQRIVEISANRLVLAWATADKQMPPMNFITPTHWRVGDLIQMQINRSPRDISYDDNGNIVVTIPKEPHNGWEREFYTLRNTRTNDSVTVDFDSVEGFEALAEEHKKKS
jgi:hypothetical protein